MWKRQRSNTQTLQLRHSVEEIAHAITVKFPRERKSGSTLATCPPAAAPISRTPRQHFIGRHTHTSRPPVLHAKESGIGELERESARSLASSLTHSSGFSALSCVPFISMRASAANGSVCVCVTTLCPRVCPRVCHSSTTTT